MPLFLEVLFPWVMLFISVSLCSYPPNGLSTFSPKLGIFRSCSHPLNSPVFSNSLLVESTSFHPLPSTLYPPRFYGCSRRLSGLPNSCGEGKEGRSPVCLPHSCFFFKGSSMSWGPGCLAQPGLSQPTTAPNNRQGLNKYLPLQACPLPLRPHGAGPGWDLNGGRHS